MGKRKIDFKNDSLLVLIRGMANRVYRIEMLKKEIEELKRIITEKTGYDYFETEVSEDDNRISG